MRFYTNPKFSINHSFEKGAFPWCVAVVPTDSFTFPASSHLSNDDVFLKSFKSDAYSSDFSSFLFQRVRFYFVGRGALRGIPKPLKTSANGRLGRCLGGGQDGRRERVKDDIGQLEAVS